MKLGETDVSQIRVPITIRNAAGVPTDGCVPAAGQLKISRGGGALADAAGTLVGYGGGSGAYYYQGVAADASVEGGLTVVVTGVAGFNFEMAWAPVEGASGIVAFPFVINVDGTPTAGCNPVGAGELQQSINGAAFVASTGTFTDLTLGLYYYKHNVRVTGFVLIKVIKAGFDEALAWGQSSQSSSGAAPTPAIIPTPITASAKFGTVIPIVDHIAVAISRLPQMFRGGS